MNPFEEAVRIPDRWLTSSEGKSMRHTVCKHSRNGRRPERRQRGQLHSGLHNRHTERRSSIGQQQWPRRGREQQSERYKKINNHQNLNKNVKIGFKKS